MASSCATPAATRRAMAPGGLARAQHADLRRPGGPGPGLPCGDPVQAAVSRGAGAGRARADGRWLPAVQPGGSGAVSYTHLRAHETRHDLVCRLLLENKKENSAHDNLAFLIINIYGLTQHIHQVN